MKTLREEALELADRLIRDRISAGPFTSDMLEALLDACSWNAAYDAGFADGIEQERERAKTVKPRPPLPDVSVVF